MKTALILCFAVNAILAVICTGIAMHMHFAVGEPQHDVIVCCSVTGIITATISVFCISLFAEWERKAEMMRKRYGGNPVMENEK